MTICMYTCGYKTQAQPIYSPACHSVLLVCRLMDGAILAMCKLVSYSLSVRFMLSTLTIVVLATLVSRETLDVEIGYS